VAAIFPGRGALVVKGAEIKGILFGGLLGALAILGVLGATEAPRCAETHYVSQEVLVRFHPWVDEREKARVRDALGATRVQIVKGIRVEHWRLSSTTSTEQALQFLKNTPGVEWAEPNYLYRLQAVPNDPLFERLWYLNNVGQTVNGVICSPGADIDAARAWDLESGSRRIIIAVIDTGVAFEHPDLAGNVWINGDEIPGNNVDDDHNGYVDDLHGWDFVNDDNNPADYSRDLYGDGHGTHVAGIIAAQGNNGVGTAGVVWRAQLMPLQVFDLFQESAFNSAWIQQINITRAVLYAVDNGAKIINCSFGGSQYSVFQRDAMAYANEHGVLVVVAAGNESSDNDNVPMYPAGYALPNIISVAATDETDSLAAYSNYGARTVDVAAPGGGLRPCIYSTIPPERQTIFHDDFQKGGGQWITWGRYEAWSIGYSRLFHSNVLMDSVYGYHANEYSYARMARPVNASNCRGIFVQFDLSYDLEEGYDYLVLEASRDGINWFDLDYLTGYSNGISPYVTWSNDHELGTFYLGFRLETDSTVNYDGVAVDNIHVTGIPWFFSGDEYGWKSGTSMAAPVVSGVAALIWSCRADLSHLEVKQIIMDTADVLPTVAGRVVSGGRVNAYRALVGAASFHREVSPVVGDWNGDGRDDLGIFLAGSHRFLLDVDGDGWHDVDVGLGAVGDLPVTGDWNGDGRDDLGVFRPSRRRFYLDADLDGVHEKATTIGRSDDIPLVGDWDSDGEDDIGVFRPSARRYYMDADEDGIHDRAVTIGRESDVPLVGDWDGDGVDSIGVYRPSTGRFYLDDDDDGLHDHGVTLDVGMSGDLMPVTGDWDGDGRTEVGLFDPESRTFFLDRDMDGVVDLEQVLR
jgi:subtilisin family serine protease